MAVQFPKAVKLSGKETRPQDNPVNDPPRSIVFAKKNAITGETTSQGLGGAVFSIEYYALGKLTRTMMSKADETAPVI